MEQPQNKPIDPTEIAALLNDQLSKANERADKAEADKKAIYEEFAKAGSREEAISTARDFIEESLPDAILVLRELMVTSESDSVRASAAKFVVSTVIDRKLEDKDSGELKSLLSELAKDVPKGADQHVGIVKDPYDNEQ